MIIRAFMALQAIRTGSNLVMFSDKVVCTTLSEGRDLRGNVLICNRSVFEFFFCILIITG